MEVDNETEDGEVVGNKATKIYKQNPILNGFHILSELENVSESGYFESPLGYDDIDWYVNEFIKNRKQDEILLSEY